MAVGKGGDKMVTPKFPKAEGPTGVKAGAPTFNNSKGPLGFRQTYKQTGSPGNGIK